MQMQTTITKIIQTSVEPEKRRTIQSFFCVTKRRRNDEGDSDSSRVEPPASLYPLPKPSNLSLLSSAAQINPSSPSSLLCSPEIPVRWPPLSTTQATASSLGSPDFSFRSPSAARVATPSLGSPDISAPSPPTSRIGAVSLGSPDFSFRSPSAARVAAPSLGSPDLSVCSPPSSNAQFDALSLESPEILIRSPTPSVSAADVTLSRCSSSECEALDRTSVYFYLMKECATAKKLFKTTAAPKDISRCCDDLPAQPMLQNFPTNRQKRSFQPNWYRDYSWLEYSIESDACYCFTCRHFPANQSHIHDAFSTTGFNNWKNSLGKAGGLTKHVLSQSHLVSTKNYQSFKLGSQTSSNVMNRLDNHRAVHIAKNRQRLAKICSTLHLLARQMVAFRGHDEQEG